MSYKHEPSWYQGQSFFLKSAPENLQSWLIDRGSLTQRLIKSCKLKQGKFHVKVYDETWAKPQLSEARHLGMKNGEMGFIRQVHLYCDEIPWVYARTIIPRATLHGELQKLTNLGTQPLGAVLFANKHINRGSIEIAKLTKKHTMFDVATTQITERTRAQSEEIWGRRSVFKIGSKPLLVSEIFLPDLD